MPRRSTTCSSSPRRRRAGEELGALARRRPDLEMRRAGPRERAGAEERAAQVGAAAARRATRRARRPLERRERRGQSTPASFSVSQRARVAGDVHLVAGRPLERVLPVGADLRVDAELAQEAEGAARDRVRATSRWTATSPRPRTCKLPAVWKSAESSASRSQSRRGAIAASSSRSSSDSDMLEREQAPLVVGAERAVAAEPGRRDDAVARIRIAKRLRAQNVPAARAAPGRPRAPRARRRRRSRRAAPPAARAASAARTASAVEVELDVGEVVGLAAEERGERAASGARVALVRPDTGSRQLVPDERALGRDDRADAELAGVVVDMPHERTLQEGRIATSDGEDAAVPAGSPTRSPWSAPSSSSSSACGAQLGQEHSRRERSFVADHREPAPRRWRARASVPSRTSVGVSQIEGTSLPATPAPVPSDLPTSSVGRASAPRRRARARAPTPRPPPPMSAGRPQTSTTPRRALGRHSCANQSSGACGGRRAPGRRARPLGTVVDGAAQRPPSCPSTVSCSNP